MRILQVIGSYIPAWRAGGPIKSVSNLCRKLVELGHEVEVFTTNVDGAAFIPVPTDKTAMIDGVAVHYYKALTKSYAFSPALASAIKRTVRSFDVVHIHSVFYWPTLAGAFYAHACKIPYIISPRGILDPACMAAGRLKKTLYTSLIERRNLKNAALLHFTSQQERMRMGISGLEVASVVVPNGIRLEEFSVLPQRGHFREKYPALQGKLVVFFMSRICWKKGLDILVGAFSLIAKERDDVRLVIAGPDDEGYGVKVKNAVRSLGLEDKVIFTGMLLGQDKLEAFVDSDIFCLPSYQENFGMVVAEAMACGLAVVISDQVNIHREITGAGAGLVNRCDAAETAISMRTLLDNPELRKGCAVNAKKLVADVFDLNKTTRQMEQVYKTVIGDKR